eukprot:CAMPEP_0175960526 /NCGR_PEP_ID=MMETSP0108-20121206/35419_1 /TAXON_ID=195067 ORGANISM="Goniomonas pacifica, Strain CCMP1869" /NCGR_SAMPLE_ID=MMETSP0108 /ASSEMBLY_ACC=CAM_ASM_000204 /LENGTH=38 /DNA_ID= /DNA_START= /DNA_END= /DNA_ORIENTATION=
MEMQIAMAPALFTGWLDSVVPSSMTHRMVNKQMVLQKK